MSIPVKEKIKRALVFIFVVFCLLLANIFLDDLKIISKIILDSRWSMVCVAVYIVACAIFYQIYVRAPVINSAEASAGGSAEAVEVVRVYENYYNLLAALIAYLPASTSSIVLIRGLFNQHFYSIESYPNFDKIDLVVLLIASSVLLFHAIYKSTKNLIVALNYHGASPVTAGSKATLQKSPTA